MQSIKKPKKRIFNARGSLADLAEENRLSFKAIN